MAFEDIVRAHYFHEIERRRELNAALSLPLGVLTALFAAIAAMLTALAVPLSAIEIAVIVPCALASVAGGISICHAFQSYIGYTYRHPTSMGALSDWRDKALADGISQHRVQEDIRGIMTEQYAASAELNSFNNDSKSAHIHNAGVWLAVCLVLVILAGLPYTYLRITAGSATSNPVSEIASTINQNPGADCDQRRPARTSTASATSSTASDEGRSRESGSAKARIERPASCRH